MKIVVCVKQVPATGEQRLDPVTGTVIREGVALHFEPLRRLRAGRGRALKRTAGRGKSPF